MKRLVIFDLDGTLLNTIADLAESTNYSLRENGFKEHALDEYPYFVGNGINKLFERALPEGMKTEENIMKIRKTFLEYYDEHNCDKTLPYKGIRELLEGLQDKNISMAITSNKYDSAAKKIISHFFGNIRFISVLGNVEGVPTKPDPQIIYNTLRNHDFKKEEILYVGDSGVDMQTANNAGIDACGVTWGFRPVEELKAFNPRYIADKPEDILAIVDK